MENISVIVWIDQGLHEDWHHWDNPCPNNSCFFLNENKRL
jgi:hypothetical protein